MAEAMLGPAVGPALAVLVVNDHVLKVRWPGFVTGKLSDAAGLVILPVVLVAMIEGIRIVFRSQHPTATGRELAVAAGLSAAAFTAVKTSAWVAAAYSDALGWVQWPVRGAAALVTGVSPPGHSPVTVLADPSDLLALPAIAIGVVAAQRASRTPRWHVRSVDSERGETSHRAAAPPRRRSTRASRGRDGPRAQPPLPGTMR